MVDFLVTTLVGILNLIRRLNQTRKGKSEMSMFSGITEVSSSQGGQWVKPGKHHFKITALKSPPRLRAGQCFIAELKVISSTNPDYTEGQSVSWVRNITKHKEMALGDVKAFIAAALNIKEDQVNEEIADGVVAPDQPLKNYEVLCEAFNRPTKDGGEFTRTLWTYPE